VVFEVAVVPPSPDTFAELYREPWDPAIQSRRLVFELKAGNSDKEDRAWHRGVGQLSRGRAAGHRTVKVATTGS
jgi:hypothetical protein